MVDQPRNNSLPTTAGLDDPLYYLANMETVLGWVSRHHGDLLTTEEQARLVAFNDLSRAGRALLTRMIMRTGELFRADKLRYPELPAPEPEALAELIHSQWLEDSPELTLDDLFRLYTLADLRPAFAARLQALALPKTLPKARMRELLSTDDGGPRSAEAWLGTEVGAVVRVADMALFDRVRLMFFGNLRQSWSDFVLVELGHQTYETVVFSAASRAFDRRADVDCYLAMHRCRERLDQGIPVAELWPTVPAPSANSWLTSRRDRLLLELGRQAERQGERELALQALAASGHREARLKQLRLLERMRRYQEAWDIAEVWAGASMTDAEAEGLARIQRRLAAKVGVAPPEPASRPDLHEYQLTLPASGSVERAVQSHYWQDQAPVYYTENTLINGLFGLLCWQTIFQMVPGAFFHPFHTGPVDLLRDDFVARRQPAFDRCFEQLADGSYRQQIVDNWRAKQGVANPFVVWPVLTEELLVLALECIPARHLEALFRRLLRNLKVHRSGFPDLIRFNPRHPDPNQRYEMIEVKGPGDRLQDHQRRWLAFFAREGIAASVCYVRWQEPAESEAEPLSGAKP